MRHPDENDEDALSIRRGPDSRTISQIFTGIHELAERVGDTALVALCERAYRGNTAAIAECQRLLDARSEHHAS